MHNHQESCHQSQQTQQNSHSISNLPKTKQTLIDKSIFTQSKVIMILDDSYIMIHHNGQLYLIDQHAACQKILYMDYYEKLKSKKQSQEISNLVIYNIPNIYKGLLRQCQKQINQLGWSYHIGHTKGTSTEIYILREPIVFNYKLKQAQLLYYLEEMYDNSDDNWNTIKHKIDLSLKQKQIIAEKACHKSYRFGQKIQLQKAQEIVRKLKDIQAPFSCPHSRVLISYFGNAHQLGVE